MVTLLVFWFVILASTVEGKKREKIHLLKIRLPERADRDESSDLSSINTILNSATGVQVKFSVKEVGNPNIFAVLEIEIDCQWAQITNKLSARGDTFSTTPLFSCQDFARDVNVTLPDNDDFQSPSYLYHLSHPINGRNESKYLLDMADILRKISVLSQRNGGKIACFRDTIAVPLQMYLFTDDSSAIDLRYSVKIGAGVDYELKLHRIQDLNNYVTACSS